MTKWHVGREERAPRNRHRRITRRSAGLGWWIVGSLWTTTGRSLYAERRRRCYARNVFRKIRFEISARLHTLAKGLPFFLSVVSSTKALLNAGRMPTACDGKCLIPLSLRERRAFPLCFNTGYCSIPERREVHRRKWSLVGELQAVALDFARAGFSGAACLR